MTHDRIIPSLLRGAAAIALFSQAGVAMAQSAADESAQPQAEEASVDKDIVVVGTAGAGTRRQDAAFAVTTLSNDAIERAAPNSTADVLRTIPGVSAESSGGQNGANIFVRGYPSGGDAQFVTFQMGGVPVFPPPTLSFLENSQLIRLDETVQRVEAVRGGTGSLFSNGQSGLTVNVVQRKGGSDLAGLAKVSLTDFGEVRGDAWISGPISSDTGFMVGGYYARSHGVRDPQFTAEKGGQITANISHDFANGSLLIYGRYLNDHGQWLLPIPIVQDGSKVSEFAGFDAGTGALQSKEFRVVTRNDGRSLDFADGRGARIGHLGMNFDHDLIDNLRIRDRMSFVFGHADTVGLVPAGPPRTAAAYATSRGGAISTLSYVHGGGAVSNADAQQVMVAGAWEVRKRIDSFVNDLSLELETGNNKLTAGFYLADYGVRERWALGNQMLMTAEDNARLLNMTLTNGAIVTRDGFVSGNGFQVNGNYSGNDHAFYLVDELQITPELRIDGGVRWQRHKVVGTLENQNTGVNIDGNALTLYDNTTNVLNGTFRNINYKHSAWSWTAGANYDITGDVGVFARYSVGRNFPQFDNLREASATNIANNSGLAATSRVDTYEAGLKVSTPLINLYATLFHNKFDGLSTTTLINNVPVSSNGGAKATGLELEGVVRPVSGLSLGFSGTYLDATYRGFFTGNGTIDNTGNNIQRQPKWTWRLMPAYEMEFGNFKPSVFATLQYTGDRFSDPENNQLLPHYYQLDAGVAFELSGIKFQVTGNNLTNEIGLTEGNPRIIGSQGSGAILARPILGRSFRFSAAYSF